MARREITLSTTTKEHPSQYWLCFILYFVYITLCALLPCLAASFLPAHHVRLDQHRPLVFVPTHVWRSRSSVSPIALPLLPHTYDRSSAYSLSGHVSISLSSPYSFFSTRRTARVLLESVSLTFEGQSEINTPETGYAAIRLCSVSRDIAPSEPMELTNHGHEDDSPCTCFETYHDATDILQRPMERHI